MQSLRGRRPRSVTATDHERNGYNLEQTHELTLLKIISRLLNQPSLRARTDDLLEAVRLSQRPDRAFRFCVGDHGQALVETALALSLLVFTLMGGADIARVYAAQLAVENASRAGAEAAAMKVATTDPLIISYASDELGRVAGVDPAQATITITRTTGAGGESLVNVRVRYTFRTLTPWPGIPNSVALDRTTTFRNYP